jgi:single-stranded-DNA-specific exonuclease
MIKVVVRPRQTEAEALLNASGLSGLMSRLLAARGIASVQALSTSLAQLIPPHQLTNNAQMATLLADAILLNKKILVIGDYDADGATATAVAVKGLRTFGAQVDFLVPNRFEYGYGLTPEIVALAATSNPDIILTVDNGIASVDGVAKANALGIQVLITDHHLPSEVMPDAACMINPNQHGCDFPSKHLAGVGVMFYALLALRAEFRTRGAYKEKSEPNLTELLDLVALGTVADLVKLDANNRILVEQGLRRIRAGVCSPGILALLRVSGRQYQTANAQDLGFYVGPRLNAAGRLDDMTLGIQCLLTDDPTQAAQIAAQLQALNQQRRSIEADMQESAMIELEDMDVGAQYALSVYQSDWHQGVIGILASRIKERYYRPVIAFAEANDGLLKGSGRSIAGLHLRDALDLLSKHDPDLIIKFGGHAMAAGLTIKKVDFVRFQQGFEQVVRRLITEADLDSMIEVDGALDSDDMHVECALTLDNQVWGQGFPAPLFFDAFEVVQQRLLAEKHLKLTLKKSTTPQDTVQSDTLLDAIFFNQTDFLPAQIKVVYQLQANRYNGAESVQLNIRHVIF